MNPLKTLLGRRRPALPTLRPERKAGTLAPALAVTALALGAMAAYNRARARQAERDHPPRGRFVEVDGVRLHYVERGAGTSVVLLHGNGSMTRDFEISQVVELAAARHRVIAFDRPGYGFSERPRGRAWTPSAQARLLAKAFRVLEIERPVVVGHSWGALVAMALAVEHPTAIRGVVLLGGYFFPSLRLDVALASVPAIPLLGDLLRHTIAPFLGRLLAPGLIAKVFAPAPVPAAFAAFPVELSLRPSQLRASAEESAMMVPAAAALSRRYREIAVPVAVVAGTGDRLVDFHRQSKRLHRELARSTIDPVAEAGHMVHHLAPRRVLAAIDTVLG
jgi:pimeloyl-ACP methyl ester carboxylesterase